MFNSSHRETRDGMQPCISTPSGKLIHTVSHYTYRTYRPRGKPHHLPFVYYEYLLNHFVQDLFRWPFLQKFVPSLELFKLIQLRMRTSAANRVRSFVRTCKVSPKMASLFGRVSDISVRQSFLLSCLFVTFSDGFFSLLGVLHDRRARFHTPLRARWTTVDNSYSPRYFLQTI